MAENARKKVRAGVRLHIVGSKLVAAAITLCTAGLTACASSGGSAHSALSAAGSELPAGWSRCSGKNAVIAEGSTAQRNAIEVFNRAWGQLCPGKSVSYHPTGSGTGREQFIAGRVDFAGSDSPLVASQIAPAAKRCKGNPAWDLPLVFDPIALIYHLPGIPTLVVDADALARIFSGAIRMWNDPVLATLNPGVVLPNTSITPVYRLDSSGTTDNLQKYLTAAAPESWSRGVGTVFQGGVGEGARKSAGMVQVVQATPGSLGYVDKDTADQSGMPFAQINTGKGGVPLTAETARNAVNAATFVASGNDLVLELNSLYATQASDVYPLVQATYEIVCSKGYDPDTSAVVKAFLATAVKEGQTYLPPTGYVRLPDKVRERLITAINAMQ